MIIDYINEIFKPSTNKIHIRKNNSIGKTDKKGTRVTFKPDARVFDTVVFDAEEIEDKRIVW